MVSKVIYKGNLRTHATHIESGNAIITDGNGESFSPPDLTAASLGCCILTAMGRYAEKNGITMDESIANVNKIMSEVPRRIGQITVDIFINNSSSISPEHRKQLEEIGRNCSVCRSLHPDIKLIINITYLEDVVETKD
ncbi:unnamed protein product [Didymodactylos carnosus]|uniref:OsmC-like protein n=1 Tax=Didymodactylos carnosus TaxID=1234261 RepID=A0A815GTT3_9BILA|nr:unnamed protein product [Didymodactylos carnosus]CAF4205556.1 unnamed protein product [Didymodactylos carnosus]